MLITVFTLLSLTFFLTGCASLTGYHDGRTVGENNGEMLLSLNLSQTPDFDESDTIGIERLYFPNMEISGRYGITERFDLGIRMNTNFNIALDGKLQVLGDRHSPLAFSIGAGIGTFGLFSALWNVQLPVYLSVHPSSNVAVYFSPRYIVQFAAGDINGSLNYFGGNVGLLIGERTKFGFDVGIYNIGVDSESGTDTQIGTFGIGVKVPLGRN